MFKVGDKVRRLKQYRSVTDFQWNLGDKVVTVTWVYRSSLRVTEDTQLRDAHYFELAKDDIQTPTKDQILSAAATSDGAKKALKVLFPNVFPKEVIKVPLRSIKGGDYFRLEEKVEQFFMRTTNGAPIVGVWMNTQYKGWALKVSEDVLVMKCDEKGNLLYSE